MLFRLNVYLLLFHYQSVNVYSPHPSSATPTVKHTTKLFNLVSNPAYRSIKQLGVRIVLRDLWSNWFFTLSSFIGGCITNLFPFHIPEERYGCRVVFGESLWYFWWSCLVLLYIFSGVIKMQEKGTNGKRIRICQMAARVPYSEKSIRKQRPKYLIFWIHPSKDQLNHNLLNSTHLKDEILGNLFDSHPHYV